jgi:hypothetical protein
LQGPQQGRVRPGARVDERERTEDRVHRALVHGA